MTAAEIESSLPALPLPSRRPFVIAWLVFWLLMVLIALRDHGLSGTSDWWKPLLWEGSSCLVATAILAWFWRHGPRLDADLERPWRWFGRALLRLPPAAVGFVASVYGLRHGIYALLGERYLHEPWLEVFAYESVKFGLFCALFLAAYFGMRSHAAMNAQRLRAESERRLAQQAQLLQLAQQIEPHFLFNALNTIAGTVHEDPDLADHLITQLAALLRAATDLAREPVRPLDGEVQLLGAYAQIMQERFSDRLRLRFDIDAEARGCRVPSLIMQPLLENAFRHGVEQHAGAASIRISAQRRGPRLELAVACSVGRVEMPVREGTGLANLRRRLAAAHGTDASLVLESLPEGGTRARIEMPCVC